MISSARLRRAKRGVVRMVYAAALIFSLSPSPTAQSERTSATAETIIARGVSISSAEAAERPKVALPEKQAAPLPRTVERSCDSDENTLCAVTLVEMQ